MEKFEAAYARWVMHHRAAIMIVCLIVIAGLGAGGAKLRFDTSYRAFFSADNPELIASENVENTYNKEANIIATLAPSATRSPQSRNSRPPRGKSPTPTASIRSRTSSTRIPRKTT